MLTLTQKRSVLDEVPMGSGPDLYTTGAGNAHRLGDPVLAHHPFTRSEEVEGGSQPCGRDLFLGYSNERITQAAPWEKGSGPLLALCADRSRLSHDPERIGGNGENLAVFSRTFDGQPVGAGF